MIEALISGKLSRDQENMEDILTSSIFGLLKLCSPKDGLLQFISLACDPFEKVKFPLKFLTEGRFDDAEVEYKFWPSWNLDGCKSCEPDVALRITGRHRSLLIAIEAKYRSPKSSEAKADLDTPNDQLAVEWDNLVKIASQEGREPFLVYLTAEVGIPQKEIQASIDDFYKTQSKQGGRPRILALSWRQLKMQFEFVPLPVLHELCRLVTRLGLVQFHGFPFEKNANISWSFDVIPKKWMPKFRQRTIDWRFNG